MNPIEIIVRVKLPEGKTQNDPEFSDTIFAIKPPGFEVKWVYGNQEDWPKDKNGFTYVPLYLRDSKIAAAYWMEECFRAQNQLEKIKQALRGLI